MVGQIPGRPSSVSDEYWHMGETNTRLGMVSPRIVIGANNRLIEFLCSSDLECRRQYRGNRDSVSTPFMIRRAHHEREGVPCSVRPCILNMDVIDRFVLGPEDRSSAGSSRPAHSEPEQLNGPYEPELGKVGPELGETW